MKNLDQVVNKFKELGDDYFEDMNGVKRSVLFPFLPNSVVAEIMDNIQFKSDQDKAAIHALNDNSRKEGGLELSSANVLSELKKFTNHTKAYIEKREKLNRTEEAFILQKFGLYLWMMGHEIYISEWEGLNMKEMVKKIEEIYLYEKD